MSLTVERVTDSSWRETAIAGEGDRIALIHALADLAGRPIPDVEAAFVLEHARQLTPERANAIWAQHRRAPATVSMRDYLAMTVKFLGHAPARLTVLRYVRDTVWVLTRREKGSMPMSLDQHGTDSRRADAIAGAAGLAGVPVGEAVAEALASVRLEGLEPDAYGLQVLGDVAAGRLSTEDALQRVLSAARVA